MYASNQYGITFDPAKKGGGVKRVGYRTLKIVD